MDRQRIAQLYRELANEFESGGGNPMPTQPNPEPTPQPTGKIPVRIFFYGLNHSYKAPIDIQINGIWYDFSVAMDVKFRINSAVGTIIHVDSPIKTIAFAKSQINFGHLNEDGFGNTNFKYGAVPPEDDLLNVNDSFWSRWVHGKANHTSYWGDIGGRNTRDPEFYKIDVRADFNDSGQFAIYASGYGENRP